MKKIKCINAGIWWDGDDKDRIPGGRVTVIDTSLLKVVDYEDYRCNGGSYYTKWIQNCKNKHQAQLMCLKMFWYLVMDYNITPAVVHKALSAIEEYQSALKTNIS